MLSIRTRPLAALITSAALAGALASCGSDSRSSSGSAGAGTTVATNPGARVSASPVQVDAAFVREMTVHHQLAIDMAAIANHRAKRAPVKRLAASITTVQKREIKQLAGAASRLHVTLDPSMSEQMADAQTLGLPMAAMGMSMDPSSLKKAVNFDRTFLSEMIPHHLGAITMARVETAKGRDPELRRLAARIIAEQNPQIALMAQLRAGS